MTSLGLQRLQKHAVMVFALIENRRHSLWARPAASRVNFLVRSDFAASRRYLEPIVTFHSLKAANILCDHLRNEMM